jgi:hypothetical protein
MRVSPRIRKITLWSIVFAWGGWVLFAWLAMSYFGQTRPRVSAPSFGRVFPFNDHGTIVYLTRNEHFLVDQWWMLWMAVELVLAAIAQNLAPWEKPAN